MKRAVLTIAVFALVALFATSAFAKPCSHGKDGGFHGAGMGFWKNEQAVEKLGLSEDQIAALDKTFEAMHTKFVALGEKKTAVHDELNSAIDSGDEEAIAQAKEKMNALHAEKLDLKVEHKQQIAKILTQEQLEKLEQIKGPKHECGAGCKHGAKGE